MTKSVFVLTTLLACPIVFAAAPVDPINKNRAGLALRGYDTVAYFEQGRPAKGSPEFTHQWMGATWQFSSAANRDLFAAHPDRYAPQFGGYCAWAVGHNYTADGDPEAWKIADGKLYLNYNKSVQKKWLQDQQSLIEKGKQNWPALHR